MIQTIISVIVAIPKLYAMVKEIISVFKKQQAERLERDRAAIIKQIETAKTDEERRILSEKLAKLIAGRRS